jgi:hypothetical protein
MDCGCHSQEQEGGARHVGHWLFVNWGWELARKWPMLAQLLGSGCNETWFLY